MSDERLLFVDGEVDFPGPLSLEDLASIPEAFQVRDVSRLDPARTGDAVSLEGILYRVGVRPTARYLTLHASADNFHASIPLEPVRGRAVLIYRLAGEALPARSGGPVRFFIPDHAACRTHEIDECANVKFVDRIELGRERGLDNRPAEEEEHRKLHERQMQAPPSD
jgi:DMSO/TMAO reductase YedYZ molybdopterin-dependent catalytic subunit